MKTLKIDEKKCTACGTCLAFAAYITEGENGKAKVIPGKKLRTEDEKNAREVAELCPEQAIQLQDVNLKRLTAAEKEKLVKGLKEKLSAIAIPMPGRADFAFDEKKYKFTSEIHILYLTGDGDYRYKVNRLLKMPAGVNLTMNTIRRLSSLPWKFSANMESIKLPSTMIYRKMESTRNGIMNSKMC